MNPKTFFFSLAILLSPSLTLADTALRYTFDSCWSQLQCADDRLCVIRDPKSTNDLDLCAPPTKNDRYTSCFCWPHPNTIPCSSSDACRTPEACALSKNDPRPFCVSCNFLKTSSDFTLTNSSDDSCNAVSSATPSPTSAKRTPVLDKIVVFSLLAFDFCTATVHCADGYKCASDYHINEVRRCIPVNTACSCRPQVRLNCTASTTCPSNQLCVRDTRYDESYCASCRITAQQVHLIPLNGNNSCKATAIPPPTPPPSPLGPNGLTFDPCYKDSQCQSTRHCVSVSSNFTTNPCSSLRDTLSDKLNDKIFVPCVCLPHDFDAVLPCTKSSDCELHEVCSTLQMAPIPYCISANFFKNQRRNEIKEVGPRNSENQVENSAALLSGDSCSFDWDCLAPRRCTHITEQNGACAGRRACTCEPLSFKTPCRRDTDCPADELCVNIVDARSDPFCRSAHAVAGLDRFERMDDKRPDYSDPSPAELLLERSPAGPGLGLPGDVCTVDDDCVDNSECRHITEQQGSCNGRRACTCEHSMLSNCTVAENCTRHEMCAVVQDAVRDVGECRSKRSVETDPLTIWSTFQLTVDDHENDEAMMSANPQPELETEDEGKKGAENAGVCIDASALRHLPQHQLVFPSHQHASVLCDRSGSCATSGHMVVWQGRAMMMKSYCALQDVMCQRMVKMVNSPRMARSLRIASRTGGLTFTSLAGRFETRFEEMCLSKIIHLGF